MIGYSVKPITKQECLPFIIHKHYLKRKCSISYAFGLFENNILVGCITYGVPSSPNIAKTFVVDGYEHFVLELNRLYLCNNKKNEASYLIAKSLRMLPKPKVVISYADSSQGHTGIIYKAANFTYLGVTKRKKEWFLQSKPNIHSSTLFSKNTLSELKEKHGPDLQQRMRSSKHRYAIVLSNKKYSKMYKHILKRN